MSSKQPHRRLLRLALTGAFLALPLVGIAGPADAQAPAAAEFVDRGWHDHDNGLHPGHSPLRKWLHQMLPHGAFGSCD
ncbi:hypothetical protein [Nocardia sp. NPDC051833]|uniref:hypothetical protein n=1 Tax=Nocardia sp. NPDC051833 TaxID=3155674 RepID=UPI00342AEEA1